jgi:hypothetical protein
MKNKIFTSIILLVSLTAAAFAQTSSFNKGTWYYGLEYYKYSEKGEGQDPAVTHKTNPWPTLALGYSDYSSLRSNNTNSIIYYLEGTYGINKYHQYTGVGTVNVPDAKLQTEIAYVSPYNIYAGLGYRYLYDFHGNRGGGYDRQNQLLYVPVGYGLKMADGSNSKFQFNYLIKGTQDTYLSDLNTSNLTLPDAKNKQKNGWGLDLSYVPVSSEWEFYAKYWNISRSETVYGNFTYNGKTYSGASAYEPYNQTYEIGFRHTF